jgi:hypothetical protein
MNQEKLNNMNATELLKTLKQTFMVRTLLRKNSKMTRKDVKAIQKQIALLLWTKFPETAKAEGLKKVRT